MTMWISVEQKMPPIGELVEVKTKTNEIRKDMIVPVGSYSTFWSGCNYSNLDKPTHWRHL